MRLVELEIESLGLTHGPYIRISCIFGGVQARRIGCWLLLLLLSLERIVTFQGRTVCLE